MAQENKNGDINLDGEPFVDLAFSDLDCKNIIFSPEGFPFDIDYSNTGDSNTIAPTPNGSMPSPIISLSPPSQLVLGFDSALLTEFENIFNDESFGHSSTTFDHFHNLSDKSVSNITLNGHESDLLKIIAQPNPTYRARYASEVDIGKNRANRYISAVRDHNQRFPYPTIRIPSWCNPNQRLYIRVTLVTVPGDSVNEQYIHPYSIRTSDLNVMQDPVNNSLYFRINENEYQTREKSFNISIIKKTQDQLRTSGALRLFNHTGACGHTTIADHCEARQMIKQYQLSRSQFAFTLVEKKNETNELLFYSPITMSDPMTEEDDSKSSSPKARSNSRSTDEIRCIPRKSDWAGGDEVAIIMPNPIKKKKYNIGFDFGEYGIQSVELDITHHQTIVVRTPPCPFQAGNDNVLVPIHIHENQTPLTTIDFHYIPPIKPMINKRLFGEEEGINDHINYKRLRDFNATDSAECLTVQMDRLSIDKTNMKLRSNSASLSTAPVNEHLLNLDKRLGQMKNALETFVRTNNPAELIRTSRFLLSKYEGFSSPLHDAIKNGHIKIALIVIDQTMDLPRSKNLLLKENERGETPLLLAAKFNQWKIIEFILKNRPELGKQEDQSGNNLFHFLANVNQDGGAKTIEDILKILPEQLKIDLLKQENEQNQTPMNIAQTNGNNLCSKLLNNHENKTE